MDHAQLLALIDERSAADPAFAALVAGRIDADIAAALSASRTRVGSVQRQDFAIWCAATGLRAAIEDAANTAGHPLRSVALTLLDLLRGGVADTIDFSLPENLGMLGGWVDAGGCTQAQADALLAMATTADPIGVDAVSDALNWRAAQ